MPTAVAGSSVYHHGLSGIFGSESLPFAIFRFVAGGAAAHGGGLEPTAAADRHAEKIFVGQRTAVLASTGPVAELRIRVRKVLVERPLGDVAVHIVQAPRVRLLRADGMRLAVAVASIQAYSSSLRGVVAERVGGRRAGAGRVFPFGFGRQAIVVAQDAAEPLRVLPGGEWRDRDGGLVRLVADAVRERRIVQRRGRSHGVDVPIVFELAVPGVRLNQLHVFFVAAASAAVAGFAASRCIFLNASYIAMNERYSPQVTSHLPIQNGSTLTRTCGPSSSPRSASLGGAAQQKLAAGDGNHFERDIRAGNFFGVRNHVAAVDFHGADTGRRLRRRCRAARSRAGSLADCRR